MNKYHQDAAPLRFSSPSTALAVLGALISIWGGALLWVCVALVQSGAALAYPAGEFASRVLCMGLGMVTLAGVLAVVMPNEDRLRFMVCRGLYHPSRGNPLNLKDGEVLPPVACTVVKTEDGHHRYILTIAVKSCTVDDVKALSSFLSSTLSGSFRNYAVTTIEVDEALNQVNFIVEDVTIDRAIVGFLPQAIADVLLAGQDVLDHLP